MSNETPMIEFTPDDIHAAIMVIDLACSQGAFKGWENINKAYVVRERLMAFATQWESILTPSTKGDI